MTDRVYQVRTGDLDVTIAALNHKAAAIRALRDYGTVDGYGLLTEVALVGGDPDVDTLYMSTERVLQDAGITYRRKDGVPNMERKPVQ